MDFLPVDPEVMTLLKDLRPFLSQRAAAATELAENCLEILTGESGRKALHAFSRLVSGSQTLADNGRRFTNPFTLFLILILLIFSFSTMTTARIIPVEGEVRDADG